MEGEAVDLPIDRAFVRLAEGQVHLRRVAGNPDRRTLCLLHSSPQSSRNMISLMRDLRAAGCDAPFLAPDTLGYGDSAAPSEHDPDIGYFADSLARVLDGLGLETIDLYGTHTGARIACEFALVYPDRTGRLVLDGITEYSPETRALFKERYTPRFAPDAFGSQLNHVFTYMRNQYLFFPWFLEDAAHSLKKTIPEPRALHDSVLDMLKALDTYNLAYHAAFQYPTDSRLPALKCATLVLNAADKYANGRNIATRVISDESTGVATAIAEFLR
jgi:pimeloyl-ACP methyl ester carboxylesterase